jgi:hypothetical protein
MKKILSLLVFISTCIAFSTENECNNIVTANTTPQQQQEQVASFPTYFDTSRKLCYPCDVSCGSESFVSAKEEACLADSEYGRCQMCKRCDFQRIWPCLSGIRSTDSSKCMDMEYMNILDHRCPVNQYLTYEPSDARYLTEEYIISVNPSSKSFALSQRTR